MGKFPIFQLTDIYTNMSSFMLINCDIQALFWNITIVTYYL